MPTLNRKQHFMDTEKGAWIESELTEMVANDLYNTQASYSANSSDYPNNLIPFVHKHMNYLRAHPAADPRQYISNLRLMTRRRG